MNSKKRKYGTVILCIYLFFLIYFLFLKNIGADYPMTYAEYISTMRNLIPLRCIYEFCTVPHMTLTFAVRFFLQLIGNIVLFFPWGVLGPVCFDALKQQKAFLIFTLVMIIVIELIQLVAMVGIFDVDDIILNVVGSNMGFSTWRKMRFVRQR